MVAARALRSGLRQPSSSRSRRAQLPWAVLGYRRSSTAQCCWALGVATSMATLGRLAVWGFAPGGSLDTDHRRLLRRSGCSSFSPPAQTPAGARSWDARFVASRRELVRWRRRVHLHRRWRWLVGLVFPNLEHRHHLIEQADRARRCDLGWYGLPPDVPASRSLGGMAGFVSAQGKPGRRGKQSTVRASTTTLLHTRPGPPTASLYVTVQRRGGHHGVEPLARLALPLVRDRDGHADPRWARHTVEEFRLAQEQALSEVTRRPVDVAIDGVVHAGEAVSVGNDWSAFILLPAEEFDVELVAHGWPMDDLVVVTITDLDPYVIGSRAEIGPLFAPRRPRFQV